MYFNVLHNLTDSNYPLDDMPIHTSATSKPNNISLEAVPLLPINVSCHIDVTEDFLNLGEGWKV